ncbi:MAG: T9SS type A sorting domain-containing protein [Rhodothermia bacterium]|nr:T9SS type A sorting domain-containing protein [Rhodothermia bacterium]
MKKLLLMLVMGAFLMPLAAQAQNPWTQAGAFPSATFPTTTNPKVNWDGHGVAVDPDGKIWYQPYYATDSTNVNWQAKKVATRVIYVFNPDGTQASFSPVKYIDLPGGKRDTLGGVTIKTAAGAKSFDPNTGRGLRLAPDGHILVSQFNLLYKLDYKTGAGLNKAVVNSSGQSIAAAAVDNAGNILVATVTPGAEPMKMYDKDFNFIGNVIEKSKIKGYSRSFLLSPDGNTIYWSGYTNHGVIMYKRADEFSPYDSTGIVLAGFDSESMTFHPVTGHLWASAGSSLDTPNRYPNVKTTWKRRTWYSFNPSTLTPKDLNDAETALESFTWSPTVPADTLGRPRGLGFSPDGKIAYATVFAAGSTASVINPTLQKFTAPAPSTGRMITLMVNMASTRDTVGVKRMIQVRGDNGGPLPDGNNITWDNATTLKPVNVGGDYWKIQFKANPEKDLKYKFWGAGDGLGDGWENGSDHVIAAGTSDVDRGLHFFNRTGGDKAYDWKPFRQVGTDSVAVLYRVYMNTKEAGTNGYDRAKNPVVGVRGDGTPGGVVDWGSTKVKLKPESSNQSDVGYHIYSGIGVYHKSESGKVQCFKYFIEPSGWDDTAGKGGCPTDGGNRWFKIPKSDSTLHWVKFANGTDAPNATKDKHNVVFSVNLAPLEAIGIFDRTRGDSLQVRGDFNGWGCSKTNFDRCLLDKVPGGAIYELPALLENYAGTEMNYKYYLDFNNTEFEKKFAWTPNGWEEPLSTTGSNRKFVFAAGTADQSLEQARFNDIQSKNIIPNGTTVNVKFMVDMKPALTADRTFNPASDSVYVDLTGDPIWALTQGFGVQNGTDGKPNGNAAFNYKLFLTDANNDMVYEGSIPVKGPVYGTLQYKYAFGTKASGTYVEEGGTTAGIGRRRTRYIQCNWTTKGTCASWPATFALAAETFQAKGNLPYEQNVVAVEPVESSQLPTAFTLSQNYPNPFNPSTNFEYTLAKDSHVKVQVFDLTGRLIQTLVDGFQTQNTYRVSFDASTLASGTYLYRMQVGNNIITRKMTFVK